MVYIQQKNIFGKAEENLNYTPTPTHTHTHTHTHGLTLARPYWV
jgi:hypothetical protein